MSPEQIEIITALIAAMKVMAGWPAGVVILAVIIGPWVLTLLLAASANKRFEAVVQMYENNVKLVTSYESVAGDLRDVVMLSCQAMQKVCDKIDQNQFCPVVRREQGGPR